MSGKNSLREVQVIPSYPWWGVPAGCGYKFISGTLSHNIVHATDCEVKSVPAKYPYTPIALEVSQTQIPIYQHSKTRHCYYTNGV
jgi:hypothetical protein